MTNFEQLILLANGVNVTQINNVTDLSEVRLTDVVKPDNFARQLGYDGLYCLAERLVIAKQSFYVKSRQIDGSM